jgi:hypothetical protein
MEMGPAMSGLSRKYMFEAVERSLERLNTDYIDLDSLLLRDKSCGNSCGYSFRLPEIDYMRDSRAILDCRNSGYKTLEYLGE